VDDDDISELLTRRRVCFPSWIVTLCMCMDSCCVQILEIRNNTSTTTVSNNVFQPLVLSYFAIIGASSSCSKSDRFLLYYYKLSITMAKHNSGKLKQTNKKHKGTGTSKREQKGSFGPGKVASRAGKKSSRRNLAEYVVFSLSQCILTLFQGESKGSSK
jgi:hypothetical protein